MTVHCNPSSVLAADGPETSQLLLGGLPPELLALIIGGLSPRSQSRLAQTCQRLYHQISPRLWHRFVPTSVELLQLLVETYGESADDSTRPSRSGPLVHVRFLAFERFRPANEASNAIMALLQTVPLPNLSTADFRHSLMITDAHLGQLARCPNLTTLDLSGIPGLSGTFLPGLARSCHRLRSLSLYHCGTLDSQFLEDFVEALCWPLEQLDLRGVRASSEEESLALVRSFMTKCRTTLRLLSLDRVNGLLDGAFLLEPEQSHSHRDDSNPGKSASSLRQSQPPSPSPGPSLSTGQHWSRQPSAMNLEGFVLEYCSTLSDVSLRHLVPHFSQLATLSFAGCRMFTAAGYLDLFQHSECCDTLSDLDLSQQNCIDGHVVQMIVQRFNSIRRLILRDCSLTDPALAILHARGRPYPTSDSGRALSPWPLKELGLDRNDIGPDGLIQIAQGFCSTLETLTAFGCRAVIASWLQARIWAVTGATGPYFSTNEQVRLLASQTRGTEGADSNPAPDFSWYEGVFDNIEWEGVWD
ncbi:uncharacterized protein BJ171DRAFT_600565 [Polychytrium aggregatum]|uniref:uncharacterized protein n=1 Tax=Polychytrium aggregatum TaxID=110093 RepID=UPI0022FE6A0A|nr:uncharacterized protein BJ171DRAFT_600565 [Polychytrium aggregatum]KAI9202832.1 hypothetical protein BJ171DRAFT_600565 [Polychytrium aggregatum]